MTTDQDFLEHFGVKGMKWGVRREQKRLARADKKWQKHIYSVPGAIKVHNAGAAIVNRELPALNNSPKYKGKKINWGMYLDDPSIDRTSKEYIRDYMKLNERAVAQAVKEVHGTSPSGKLRAEYQNNGQFQRIVVKNVEIQHAVETLPDLVFDLDVDENGQIASVQQASEELAQADLVDDFLAHYGVKGMKWGVRRTRKEIKRSNDAKRRDYALNKRAAKPHKSLINSPDRTLSNNEIRDLNKRLKLEIELKKNINDLKVESKKLEQGKKFAKEIAAGAGITSAASLVAFAKSEKGQAIAKTIMNKVAPRPGGAHYGG